jgi:predicted Zn-dependent peptidase
MKTAVKIEYENGFHFIHQKSLNDLNICSIHLFCNVGSSHETDEVRGVSHFLEHLLFQGTTHQSAMELFKEYDRLGTEFNAYTTKNFTCFYVKCQQENAQKVIDIFADIMNNATLTKKHMDKEEKVIIQEIRNKLADHNSSAQILFDSIVYKNSPFEHPIDDIRYHQTKNKLERSTILNWYKRFYRPSNMVLSVVSNQTVKFWKDLLHKSEFTDNKMPAPTITTSLVKSNISDTANNNNNNNNNNDIIIKNEPSAVNTHLIFGFRTVNQYSDKKHIFELLTHILNGMSGRIFTLLRQDTNIVYAAIAGSEEEEFTGYFSVATEFADKYVQQVIQILSNMFGDMVKKGISKEEYTIGRSRMRGQYNMLLEDSNTLTRYNGKEYLLSRSKTIVPFQDRLEKIYHHITLEQINTAAKDYFRPDNMVISIVSSKKIKVLDIQKITLGYLR